jgi:hypothetical protein
VEFHALHVAHLDDTVAVYQDCGVMEGRLVDSRDEHPAHHGHFPGSLRGGFSTNITVKRMAKKTARAKKYIGILSIPLSPGCNRAQVNRFLRHGLYLRPRIKDGKVFTPRPELIEITVMDAIYIARLAGIIDSN